MRRVVVTGMGVISSIGHNVEEVAKSLYEAKSGITRKDEHIEYNLRSQVVGEVSLDYKELIDRKSIRFMGRGQAFAYLAMREAIADSGLAEDKVSNPRSGLVAGMGGFSSEHICEASFILEDKKTSKALSPFSVPRSMGSSLSATLATLYKIQGVNYSMTSACSTSAHCIGHGAELIQMGKQDIVFAGGGDGLYILQSAMFDAMKALSSNFNDTPASASRPFDAGRDGFVISEGGSVVVLEELEHAKARGAKIYAELTGYGATSDGVDMVLPSGTGAESCMRIALATAKNRPEYINAHGTSTPGGDITELKAVKRVFGETMPYIGSTKSLTGHALGAAGSNEAIFSLIMLQKGFLAESAHIENLDPEAEGYPVLRERLDKKISSAMSNSFGFGGTNASLIFELYED